MAFSEIKMDKGYILSICILAAAAMVCLAGTTTSTTTTTTSTTTTTIPRTTTTYGSTPPALSPMCDNAGDGDIKLTVSVHDSPVTKRIVAADIQTDTYGFGDCVSTTTSHDGIDIHTLVVKFSATGVQKEPIMSQQNCYVTVEDDGRLSVQIIYQRDPPRISLGDFVRRVYCDPDNLADTELEIVPDGFHLLPFNMKSMEEAVAETPVGDITLTLVNLHGGGDYRVGDKVKVRVEYDYNEAQSGPFPVALFMANLVMYGSMYGPEEGIQYVSPNGCTPVDVNFKIISNDPINGVTVQESDVFTLKMFRLSQTVMLTVNYEASCYTIGSSNCNDQQAYCDYNALQRKKRSTNTDNTVAGTMVIEIPVSAVPSSLADDNNSGAQGAQNGDDNTGLIPGTCSEEGTSMYWILAVVLGSLLLVVIMVCLYLIYRLRLHLNKERDVKIVEKFEGHRNGGYY